MKKFFGLYILAAVSILCSGAVKGASLPRAEYPRPQFERADWQNLNGRWTYIFDFSDTGFQRGYQASTGFDGSITVPFAPESELSGVGYKDYISNIWYHRTISIPQEWAGKNIRLNFGAVYYTSEVYIDGQFVGRHFGGSSSFSYDITRFVSDGKEHNLVVKASSDLRSGLQGAGKQSLQYASHACNYTRTTGIWQTVWMEPVSPAGLQNVQVITDIDQFGNMWKNDVGSELICQLYADQQETTNAMGSYFLDEVYESQSLLPAYDILTMYNPTDIRLNTYFTSVPVNISGTTYEGLASINKYPGNPSLYQGSNNYANKVKIFRIAEMYLVAAEAYYMQGGTENERNAYNVLYQLMSARDASVQNQPVSGNLLRDLIRDERLKELCYEGFRWLDLKRYGEGFTRMASQADELSYVQGLNLQVSADNTQWLWPIPQEEIDANPQIKGQQNPGY